MNLIEGLIDQMNRVRGLAAVYDALPNDAGKLGALLMRATIMTAERVMAEGDLVEMIRAYKDLEEFKE